MTNAKGRSVALLSPPWPLFQRPSIQLGALSAFLRARHAGLPVWAGHLYLEVAAGLGYPRYRALSLHAWAAESVYAWLLHAERRERVERFFETQARPVAELRGVDLGWVASRVQEVTEDFLASRDWGSVALAGVSISLCQLTAGLYLLGRLRELAPHLTLVAGGSQFAGPGAAALFRLAPQVDWLVSGEGELPLCELVEALGLTSSPPRPPASPGLLSREQALASALPGCQQVPDLKQLPVPDYGDYFAQLAALPPAQRFVPELPLEFSRGCPWSASPQGGCAFCNLNLQWRGYRVKGPGQARKEVDQLTRTHGCLDLACMDNLLPKGPWPGLAELGRDLRIFGEIRADTPLPRLQAMARAGLRQAQVGVEALSPSLLARLRKGTTVLDNLRVMRDCEALGIACRGNLILGFPGGAPQEVEETLEALAFAGWYRPLEPAWFWLGLASPVWRDPAGFGVRLLGNHQHYAALLPTEQLEGAPLMMQRYRGDLGRQKKLWRPVARALEQWARQYAALRQAPASGPLLTLQEGGDFILLRERRAGGDQTHRLTGASAAIYRSCAQPLGQHELARHFKLAPDQLSAFLHEMRAKRLMFSQDGIWLSLAVPQGRV